MSIKSKLLISFTLTALLPILIIVSLTTWQVVEDAEAQFIEKSSVDIAIADQSFQNFFDVMGYQVSFLASHEDVRKATSGTLSTYFGEAKKPAEVARQNGGLEAKLLELFTRIGENNPMLGYVYIGNTDGGYLEWPGTGDYGDWDPRTRGFYTKARDANFKVSRRDGYYWEPDDAVYVSLQKGYKDEQGNFAGSVAIDLSLKALSKMVNDIKLGETGFIMLIQSDGTILVDGHNPENNFKAVNEVGDARFAEVVNQNDGVFETTVDGENYLANVYNSEALGWKFIGFQQKSEIYSNAKTMIFETIAISAILVLLFLGAGLWVAQLIVKPINQVKNSLREFAEGEGDLTARIRINNKDETGELANWFNQFVNSTQNMIATIKQNAEAITSVSSATAEGSQDISESANQQHNSVEQVATAATEMASTANEVAQNCASTATVSEEGLNATREGKEIIEQSQLGVEGLGKSIRESRTVIQELVNETDNINNILVSIQSIAEQTNLLALNAAIEAARAGEQGRGFAVVADEVRSLANRTQESTSEINTILASLTKRTEEVSNNMDTSLTQADGVIETTTKVTEAFNLIESNVEKIRDMTLQNASAAEEQHLVTEDINSNVIAINEMASQVTALANKLQSDSAQQNQLSTELSSLVGRFRT